MERERALEFAYQALLENAAKYQHLLDVKSNFASDRVLKQWVDTYMEAAEELAKMLPGSVAELYKWRDDEE